MSSLSGQANVGGGVAVRGPVLHPDFTRGQHDSLCSCLCPADSAQSEVDCWCSDAFVVVFVSFQGASGAGSLGSTNAWAEALELWLCLCRVFHEQDDLSSQIIRHGKSGRDCRSFAQAPKKLSERVLEILNRSSGHGQGLLGLRKPSLKRNKVHRALRFFGFPTNGLWW